jgi:hypothetical protein
MATAETHTSALAPRDVYLDPWEADVWRHEGAWWAPLSHRPHLAAVLLGVFMVVLTIVVGAVTGLPIKDADGVLGSRMWVLVGSVAFFFSLDIFPRVYRAYRAHETTSLRTAISTVMRARWSRRRLGVVLLGLVSFYATYLAYRNLKSFLPLLVDQDRDLALLDLERGLFGSDPTTMLHSLLGTGAAAHFLSSMYLFYLAFIPISLGAALILSVNPVPGLWWVTALGINWTLGVASYYLVPAMGPAFVDPSLVAHLPETGVSALQAALTEHRAAVLSDPSATTQVQSIAAFASLHVSVVFSAAIIAQLLGLHRYLTRALWAFLVITLISTVYFGWHYVADDIAGLLIGAVAVGLSAAVTGHWRVLRGAHG